MDIKINKYLIDWDTKIKRGKNFGQFQFDVKQLVRPYWIDHVVAEEFPVAAKVGDRGKSLDLVNFTTRQALEIQGRQHLEQVDYFARNKYQFFKQLKNDSFKVEWCKLNGFKLFEVYQDDELNEELLHKLGIIS